MIYNYLLNFFLFVKLYHIIMICHFMFFLLLIYLIFFFKYKVLINISYITILHLIFFVKLHYFMSLSWG